MSVEGSFEAIILGWDGIAAVSGRADVDALGELVERLCAAGVHLFFVSGTHVGDVDGRLHARPAGPGTLHLGLNQGSEVFEVTEAGPTCVWQRSPTQLEDRRLDEAAQLTTESLEVTGIAARTVPGLNRRRIDLLPESERAEPKNLALVGQQAVTTRVPPVPGLTLADALGLARRSAVTAGLIDSRITTDTTYIEIGLTDRGDSAQWAADWLARRGITGRLILVVGDDFGSVGGLPGHDSLMLVPALARARFASVGAQPGDLPPGITHVGGGPDALADLLDQQSRRRRQRRVPSIDDDPEWTVVLPGSSTMERAAEAIGTLSNGSVGLRAAREEGGAPGIPAFLVQGVYGGADPPGLLPGPWWAGVRLHGSRDADRRVLDLRTAVLTRSVSDGAVRTIRFLPAVAPRALALRVEGVPSAIGGGEGLTAPVDGVRFEHVRRDGVELARTSNGTTSASIAVAARDWERTVDRRRMVERLAAWSTGSRGDALDDAAEQLAAAEASGFDRLLALHREAWARRWSSAEVTIIGDADDQLASRFAVFHLLSAAPETGEAAVGARGLSGPAYGGHVFWDADVFVLPVLAAIQPASARAMLEYRLRRLPAARAIAAGRGCRGARFPWESAETGSDVTPQSVRDSAGRLIPIRTGHHEQHIVADVAWSAAQYVAWTGDTRFLTGAGSELVLEGARYWASRARHGDDGRAHLYGVMGPDEYHEVVDDNAFTNVMARWNLRYGAELLASTGGDATEADSGRALAEALVVGFDARRGIYEQFAGYWDLEPLLIDHVASPPVPADVVLGRERVAGSQLIKQADVLMLHHLVPDEVVPGSLAANLAFYEPRTAHGSSLSPAIHASLLARAGQPDRALELFRLASRLDLDDLTGTTAGGLHLATMGGVWQALAFGFLGLRARGSVLHVDPCLPRAWEALALRFSFRGVPIEVRAAVGEVSLRCDAPIAVRVGTDAVRTVEPPGETIVSGRPGP